MKKNLTIAALSLTTIISVGFAFIQRTESDKSKIQALEQRLIAEQQKILARQAAQEAMLHREMADQQREMAMLNAEKLAEALKNCRQRK